MSIKDLVLSARITGIVMNFPLYDGCVSKDARRMIADGRLADALAEYHRLADMGSALAKCVLAYLSLRNIPGAPRNPETAKALANAALSREPGYANYVLSYVAYYEKDPKKAINLMVKSYKAHFIPAASALGLIFGQGYGVSRHPKEAETFFVRAIVAGHIPATLMLSHFYRRGNRGFGKRILGTVLLPFAFLYVWITTRFLIFSVRTFRHFNIDFPPMFNEGALREEQLPGSWRRNGNVTNHSKNIATKHGVENERLLRQNRLVRSLHIVLAVAAAFVYESQGDFSHFASWRSSGGGVLATLAVPVWPYAASCMILWRRTTTHWARAWIFCFGMLLISVALCLWYLSPTSHSYGLTANLIVTWFQFVAFGYFGKWAFEDSFDEYKQERW